MYLGFKPDLSKTRICNICFGIINFHRMDSTFSTKINLNYFAFQVSC
uniref:Uncharacterized protein n=1 Tax=Anguilla anguilla TaxID=7936 RepID=A0A0E9P9Q5_ANGAN